MMRRSPACLVLAAIGLAAGGCHDGSGPTTSDAGLDLSASLAGGDARFAAPVDSAPADAKAIPDLTPVLGPSHLADTGLYSDFASRTLAPGVLRYAPRYPLWSDGADKERFFLLPPGQKIDTRDMDNWVFPVGTKAWKEFRVGGKLVETRLLQKVYDNPGGWWEVAYRWTGDGMDAVAAPDGAPDAGGTSHDIPSQEDCNKCHGSVSDVLVGVSAIQLSGAAGSSALSQWSAAGLLSVPPTSPGKQFAPPGTGVAQDALGYLHGNCGHCHNDRSIWVHSMSTQLRLRVSDATTAQTDAYKTTIRVKMFHTMPPDIDIGVVPGSPEKSQLYVRTGARDLWAMPPVCTKTADRDGLTLLGDWINSLPP